MSVRLRLANGDQSAFAELYDQLANRLYHYLLMQTGSPENSADLLQDIFLRLFRKRDHFRSVDNLPAYVFQVTRHEWIRWSKKNRRINAECSLLFEHAVEDESHSIESREEIAMALNEIEDHFREVIELKFFGMLTLAEVAIVIDKPPGTVATWYRRGIAQLREHIDRDERE